MQLPVTRDNRMALPTYADPGSFVAIKHFRTKHDLFRTKYETPEEGREDTKTRAPHTTSQVQLCLRFTSLPVPLLFSQLSI